MMRRFNGLFYGVLIAVFGIWQNTFGQEDRWQQSVSYQMEVEMDVATNQYTGLQTIAYTNNSPDTLDRVFFHLYYNAFQPNSMMDVRSRSIIDPDRRVMDRIAKLKPNEIGFLNVNELKMNGLKVSFEQVETILEGDLPAPILPHTTVLFETTFEGQVPLQVRRSGKGQRRRCPIFHVAMVSKDFQL
jgi:hypothetical protein